MKTIKEEVKELLEKLPDDCTIEDIQYHLYVLEKIRRGLSRAAEEKTLSHDELKKKFGQWLSD